MAKTDDLIIKFPFLKNGGLMARLIVEKNWDHSPIGKIQNWPDSLKLTLGLILSSRFPKILIWGPENICFYNDEYSLLLGTEGRHPAMLGAKAKEAWPENWKRLKNIIKDIYDGNPSVLNENVTAPIFRNGRVETAWWTFNASPVLELDGSISGILMTLLETTRQQQLVEDIKKREKRFRDFIFEVPIGIIQLSTVNYIVALVNESFLKIVDRTEEQMLGKPFFEVLSQIQSVIEPLFKNVMETGMPYYGNEFHISLHRYGKSETAFFNFVIDPVKNDEGHIEFLNIIAIETTSSVKQRIWLQESEKQFKKMVVDSPIGMAILRGKDLIVEMANNTMKDKIWNLDEAEVIGKPLLKIFSGLAHQKYAEQLFQVLKKGILISENESLVAIEAGGELRLMYLDYQFAPLLDEEGKVDGVMVTVYDVTEKVEAKNNQSEIRERLQLSVDTTGLAIWEYDLQKESFHFSEQLQTIFGFQSDFKPTVKDLFEAVYPDEVEEIHLAWKEALQSGNFRFIGRIRRTDNETAWVSVRGKLFFNNKKEPIKVIGTLRDITIEKQNQKELEKNERRLRRLVLQAPVSMGILRGPNYRVEIINESGLQLLGKTEEEMLNQPVLEVMQEFDATLARNMLDQVYFEGKTIAATEFPIKIRRDGVLEKVYINFEYNPLKNDRGDVIGVIVVGSEVTEQVLARKRVEESESRFRLLADSLPHFVWTADKHGNANYFNRTMILNTDPRLHQQEDFQWLDCIHQEERAETEKKWKKSLKDGSEFIGEHRICTIGQGYRWHITRARPLLDENGNIRMWIATSTDIQQLKEQDQQKDFFISRASHELKTPITSVKGYVQILQSMYKESTDELLVNSLNRMNFQIDKLTALIADLLDVTKLSSGGITLHKKPFHIKELVQELIEDTSLAYPGSKILCNVLDVTVNADKERISQVLLNLLTNALKYSPADNEIEIEVVPAADHTRFSVKDHGIGISKANQSKIFEKFYRVEGKSEETYPGFGIGLFIASEIVKKHGGEIGVDSAPGKGSVFYFTIPVTGEAG